MPVGSDSRPLRSHTNFSVVRSKILPVITPLQPNEVIVDAWSMTLATGTPAAGCVGDGTLVGCGVVGLGVGKGVGGTVGGRVC